MPTTLSSALGCGVNIEASRVRYLDHLALLPLLGAGDNASLQDIIENLQWMKLLSQDEDLVSWNKGLSDTPHLSLEDARGCPLFKI